MRARVILAVATLAMLAGCARPSVRPKQANFPDRLKHVDVYITVPQRALGGEFIVNRRRKVFVVDPTSAVATLFGSMVGLTLGDHLPKTPGEIYAETHLKPLRDSLSDVDVAKKIQTEIQHAFSNMSWGDKVTVHNSSEPGHDMLRHLRKSARGDFMVISSTYAMAADFRAVHVVARAEMYSRSLTDPRGGSRWRRDPVYKNQLIYQSNLITFPKKTQDDVRMLIDAENANYRKSGLEAKVRRINSEGTTGESMRTRREIARVVRLHQKILDDAKKPNWTTRQLVDKCTPMWLADNGKRLKATLQEGVGELGWMLAYDLEPRQSMGASGKEKAGRFVVKNGDDRTVIYTKKGLLESLGEGESLDKPKVIKN
ncbi:MAG: hypothetical protein PVG21_08730 [Gammaproteobacteria bacterium]|jgi:hypothetical protein